MSSDKLELLLQESKIACIQFVLAIAEVLKPKIALRSINEQPALVTEIVNEETFQQ